MSVNVRFRPAGCVPWTSSHLHDGFSSRLDPISAQFTVSDTCLNSEKGGLYFLSTKERLFKAVVDPIFKKFPPNQMRLDRRDGSLGGPYQRSSCRDHPDSRAYQAPWPVIMCTAAFRTARKSNSPARIDDSEHLCRISSCGQSILCSSPISY